MQRWLTVSVKQSLQKRLGETPKAMERAGEVAGAGEGAHTDDEEVVDRLGLLNQEFFAMMARRGWTPELLSALILSREEAKEVLVEAKPELFGRQLEWGVDAFWNCIRVGDRARRRPIQEMARACKQPRLTSHLSGASSLMAENYEAFVSESTYLSRQIYKSQRKRALCLEGGDPVAIEDAETKRWAMGLGTIVAEAELPAKKIAEATMDPAATWLRLCGNRRARTLRQGVRSWEKFSIWLKLAKGVAWPNGPSDIIDYLEERALEPCGPTIPGSLLMALQLVEAVGGVPRGERLGYDSMVLNVVQNLKKQLEVGSPPKKTAPVFTVATVMSLELLVIDASETMVARVLAWSLLIMVWGSLRTDDLLWLDRSRCKLSELGWKGVLLRSKTSGAGRRVKELPVFVHRLISLTGADWMRQGQSLHETASERFPGIQFLCQPRKDGSEFSSKYLQACTLAAWLKWLLLRLKVPTRKQPGWILKPDRFLFNEDWVMRWSGHSARHCGPSWSAALGVPAEQRHFLGRWKAGVETEANSYVLTSRQIVHSIQERIVKCFCEGEPSYLESETFEEIKRFGTERGLDPGAFIRAHNVWLRRGSVVALFQSYPLLDDTVWRAGFFSEDADQVDTLEEDPVEGKSPRFWVSVSRKTGFRRLHKVGGCGVRPEMVHKSEIVWELSPNVADKRCLICFGKGEEKPQSPQSDSTSGSSSSSETEEESEGFGGDWDEVT